MDNSDWATSTAYNNWLNTSSTCWTTNANWSGGSGPGSSDGSNWTEYPLLCSFSERECNLVEFSNRIPKLQ